MPSLIDMLFDRVAWKCAKCGAPSGTCGCWTLCRCGWRFETGGACNNPLHKVEDAARELAQDVAGSVLMEVRAFYPEPMKHASGGFRIKLKATMERAIAATMVEWMMADEKARAEMEHREVPAAPVPVAARAPAPIVAPKPRSRRR